MFDYGVWSSETLTSTDGDAVPGATDEHEGGNNDLDDLYGGDAVEAAGEAAAGSDTSDADAEVETHCIYKTDCNAIITTLAPF